MTTFLTSVLTIATATLLAVLPSRARDALVPITECPEEEAGDTCEVGGLAWYGPTSKAPIRRHISGDKVIKQFLVTGRLNGGRARSYALTFSQPTTDYFAATNRSGPIAHDTASLGEKHLVVRTNQGSLRILSSVGIEPPPHIVIVDERSWQVVARYSSPCIDLTFLNRVKPFWDEGRHICVAPLNETQETATAKNCTKPKRVPVCSPYEVPKGFLPAIGTKLSSIDAAVRDFRTLRLNANNTDGTHFGGSGWSVRAYRVTGTHYLVLRGLCGDCDE
ncbi:MAG: hypothetical protein KBA31_19480 [Alphaproteobacteria bacterium]|nr:hypothetical protein [Alphaproteobacteria bacterium]